MLGSCWPWNYTTLETVYTLEDAFAMIPVCEDDDLTWSYGHAITLAKIHGNMTKAKFEKMANKGRKAIDTWKGTGFNPLDLDLTISKKLRYCVQNSERVLGGLAECGIMSSTMRVARNSDTDGIPLTPKARLTSCLVANVGLLVFVLLLILLLNDNTSAYFKFGPSPTLHILTVKVNTWSRWAGVLFVLFIIRFVEVVLSDMGVPIIQFNVYNPHMKYIPDFTRRELTWLTNSMITVSMSRGVLLFVIAVTQVDIAMWSALVQCTAGYLTTYWLTRNKRFKGEPKHNDEDKSRVGGIPVVPYDEHVTTQGFNVGVAGRVMIRQSSSPTSSIFARDDGNNADSDAIGLMEYEDDDDPKLKTTSKTRAQRSRVPRNMRRSPIRKGAPTGAMFVEMKDMRTGLLEKTGDGPA